MKLEEILPEIRKGRRFKRKHFTHWEAEGVPSCDEEISLWSILSEDWELEPIKKLISREDLEMAWDKTVFPTNYALDSKKSMYFENFCKELGL